MPDVQASLLQPPVPPPTAAPPVSPVSQQIFSQAERGRQQGENPSGDPNAQNPVSSAGGKNQIIDQTWIDQIRKNRPDLSHLSNEQVLLLKPSGPLNDDMAQTYDHENAKTLQNAGLAVTPTSLKIAYRLGAGGAVTVLHANPSARLRDILPVVASPGNGDIANLTVGEFLSDPYPRGKPGIHMPETGPLPPWMSSGGSQESNIFRDMLAKQSGELAAGNEHLKLAREAEREMMQSAPKPVSTPPAQQWGSFAMAVAALGGLLTHTPITTAFNAAAGVLNAFKKGDMDAAAEQFQQWKASHDAALKMADLEIKQYESAIRSAGNAPRQAQAEMAALTASYKNDYANTLWNQGRVDEALAVHAGMKVKVDDMANAGKNFEAQGLLAVANKVRKDHPDWDEAQVYLETNKLMKGSKEAGALDEDTVARSIQMEHPDWDEAKVRLTAKQMISAAKKTPTPGSPGAERQAMHDEYHQDHPDMPESDVWKLVERDLSMAKSGASPESVHNTAQLIASYQEAPLSSFAMARGLGAQIMAEVKNINPDYQASRFAEVNRAMTAFGPGKQGDTIRYLNVAVQHLDVLEKAVEALHNGDTRVINRAFQNLAAATGEAAPVTFDGLKHIIGTEVQKAVAGGIGAIADRDRLLEALDRANSPAQLTGPDGVIEGFKRLMAGQAQGLKKQYEDATGFATGPFAFDTKLLPATKSQLNLLQGDGQKTGAPAEGQTATAKSGKPIVFRNGQWEYQ